MLELVPLQPIDYLAVGHLTLDATPQGTRLGGSAAYAALTARAMGLRAGIVASIAEKEPLEALRGIPLALVPTERSTIFENIPAPAGRKQILRDRAERILLDHIPQAWRGAPIIHLAPVADEMDDSLAEALSASILGITPQGWMRQWDARGEISPKKWMNAAALNRAGAVILSLEDVGGDLELAEEMAHHARLLCLTEGAAGATLYWNGDRRRFRAPAMEEIDSTGAGDIFAAAFFIRLMNTRDPWEAARFAAQLAARSVTRPGLEGIPAPNEIEECLTEVLL